jgi:hypothetical protein
MEKLRQTWLIRGLIAATILFSGLALVPHVELPATQFSWQSIASLYHCDEDCLISAGIQMQGMTQGQNARVKATALIKDENNNPIQSRVTAEWTLPNGNTGTQVKFSNTSGIVTFTAQDGLGTYTITITNLERPGYTFDWHNSVLTKSITLP